MVLTNNEREIAPKLHEMLLKIEEMIKSGDVPDYQIITEQAIQALVKTGFRTDYLAICSQADLQLATSDDNDLVILAAAYLGKTRLIDNLTLRKQPLA